MISQTTFDGFPILGAVIGGIATAGTMIVVSRAYMNREIAAAVAVQAALEVKAFKDQLDRQGVEIKTLKAQLRIHEEAIATAIENISDAREGLAGVAGTEKAQGSLKNAWGALLKTTVGAKES